MHAIRSRTNKIIAGAIVTLVTSLSLASVAMAADTNAYDHTFLQTAATAGGAEMATSKVVAAKHPSEAIKTFAAAMTKDHGWVAVASKKLLADKGIKVNHEMSKDSKAEVAGLKKLDGKAFDVQYAKLAVEGHKLTMDLFTDASKNAADADVKAFAAKMVPQVTSHYQMALDLQAAVAKE